MEVPGYSARQVDDLVALVASELDDGISPSLLIENAVLGKQKWGRQYDIDAVDWFLDRFLLPPDHAERGGIADDPWGDLPVARVARITSEKDAFKLQCERAWRDFGQVPGTRLGWGTASRGRTELRTAEQQTLVSVQGLLKKTFSAGGRSFTWQQTSAADSSFPFRAQMLARVDRDASGHYAGTRTWTSLRSPVQGLADETGTPILYTAGRNYNWRSYASISFPDQRWLRFLVRAAWPEHAIMTAVDQAGNKIARYKRAAPQSWGSVEIMVHPGLELTDELALALAISLPWLDEYFERPRGGG